MVLVLTLSPLSRQLRLISATQIILLFQPDAFSFMSSSYFLPS
jgi:hypothetical protein